MNKKVLWSMIVLLWVCLSAFLAIKIFFGEELVAIVNNERIKTIGNYIDNNVVTRLIADTLLSVLTLHFYLCACKKTWNLRAKEYILVIAYSFVINISYLCNPHIAMYIDLIGLIFLPFILNSEAKQTLAIFILHELAQPITLVIRSEPLYLANTDYATQLILVFDLYIWLTLYYLYSNMYKEESLWEKLVCPFSVIREKLNTKRKSKD